MFTRSRFIRRGDGKKKLKNVDTRRLIEATCPEYRGPLSEIQDDSIVHYECLVGHKYSAEGLLLARYETEERALWATVVGLEEAQKVVQGVAPHLPVEAAQNVRRDAEDNLEQAHQIRRVLDELRAYRLGNR